MLILVNDLGYATQNPEVFTGNAMTYYGRWMYKYEEAVRQGAAAALIIHQKAPAAYGWDTVRNSWTGPQFSLQSPNGNMDHLSIEGWLSQSATERVFERAELDWDHFGTDPSLAANGEDLIYNGALDSASGTAALLELAEAFADLPERSRRSIIFLSVTAEEQGLLGSAHDAASPIYPLAQTVAGLNMDGLSNFGATHELWDVGTRRCPGACG